MTPPLHIVAPGISGEACNEAEMLGSLCWLLLHSNFHRDMPLYGLGSMLLPAIARQQFLLLLEAGRPVAYLTWAHFDADAETRFLSQHPVHMPAADWQSGDRLWLLDFVAPFGHSARLGRLLRDRVFPGQCLRYLDHRGDSRGLRIRSHHGTAVSPEAARQWFALHPVRRPSPPPAPVLPEPPAP